MVFEQAITGPFRTLATTPNVPPGSNSSACGRIELPATIEAEGLTAARFEGSFVAMGG